jgi:hypothetical protein
MQVRGKALEIRRGGTEVPDFVDLDAGGGRKLAAGMKPYSCLRGTCYEDPPLVGTEGTLDCVGAILFDTPVLAQCEPQ